MARVRASTCDVNRPGFCERARFETLVCALDDEKKVSELLDFVSKHFPKTLIMRRKGIPEFEYCRLGFEELRVVNEYLGTQSNKQHF